MKLLSRFFGWTSKNIWRIVSLTLGLIVLYIILVIFLPIIELFMFIDDSFDFISDIFDNLEREIEKFEWQNIEKLPDNDESA